MRQHQTRRACEGGCFRSPSYSKILYKEGTAASIAGRAAPLRSRTRNNIAKIIADALNAVAYQDDAQIILMRLRRAYSDTPRVVETVCPL